MSNNNYIGKYIKDKFTHKIFGPIIRQDNKKLYFLNGFAWKHNKNKTYEIIDNFTHKINV